MGKSYGVSSYGFIGGAYGKSNERAIMEEIKKNGPVVVSFEPNYDFMYYGGGIYHSLEANWMSEKIEKPEWVSGFD